MQRSIYFLSISRVLLLYTSGVSNLDPSDHIPRLAALVEKHKRNERTREAEEVSHGCFGSYYAQRLEESDSTR